MAILFGSINGVVVHRGEGFNILMGKEEAHATFLSAREAFKDQQAVDQWMWEQRREIYSATFKCEQLEALTRNSLKTQKQLRAQLPKDAHDIFCEYNEAREDLNIAVENEFFMAGLRLGAGQATADIVELLKAVGKTKLEAAPVKGATSKMV